MSDSTAPLLRVRNWDQRHENNRSRGMKRTEWFPASNDLSADRYVELVSHQDGPAHLGVWHAVLMVASRARPRGLLVREDCQPHNSKSLARVTRLPETVVETALARLLDIGFLEIADSDTAGTGDLGRHPGAEIPQAPAGKPQHGAVEGKGIEHHHQEEKRKRKEQQRTEPDRTEGAREESTTEHSNAQSGHGSDFPRKGDDEGEPRGASYASSEDELKAIFQSKSGETITLDVLSSIRSNLELTVVTMDDFVLEVRKHAKNDWRNPSGFLRDLSKRFRAKTHPASAPVTAAEAEEKSYRCPHCGSRARGEGAILDADGKPAPCSCASPEYVARQRERGVFAIKTGP
jgi:hypothetical protein